MQRLGAVGAFIAGVLLSFCGLGAAENYPIKLERPTKVGEIRRVRESGSERIVTVVTANGLKVKEEVKEVSVRLEAEQKALEVSTKGIVTQLECVVGKCEVTKDGKTSVLVPAGKKINVSRELGKDSPTFSVDDHPLPQEVADRLNLVLAVGDANKPDEDETFGTNERKSVGDTWEGNKELIFNTLKDMKVPVQKDGIATSVKLRDVRNVSGVSCGIIDCSFSVPLAPGTRLPGMPEWMKIQSGKLDMLIQETLPVDVAGKPQGAARHLSMTIVVGGTSPDGAAIVTTMTRLSQAEGTRDYPK